MDLLQNQLSDNVLDQISQQLGAGKAQTAQAANGVFASLVGGLANQATSPQGLNGLMKMLDANGDGNIMDDLAAMMTGSANNQRANMGMNLIGQILGNNQQNVVSQISQASGLNSSQIMRLLPALAPVVLSVLARAMSQGNVNQNGMAGMLANAVGSMSKNPQMAGILGNLAGSLLAGGKPGQKPGGGIGGLLGGLFGKK